MEGIDDVLDCADPCADCDSDPSPALLVAWSPAFGRHLCATCRVRRTEAELNATERDNAEARLAAKRRS